MITGLITNHRYLLTEKDSASIFKVVEGILLEQSITCFKWKWVSSGVAVWIRKELFFSTYNKTEDLGEYKQEKITLGDNSASKSYSDKTDVKESYAWEKLRVQDFTNPTPYFCKCFQVTLNELKEAKAEIKTLKDILAEVSKGQQGELKGDFIRRIMELATHYSPKIK